jgi:glycosyltransferase involved in cell wall biosynthesis
MTALLVYIHGSADLYGSDRVLLSLAIATLDDPAMKPVVVLHEDGPLKAALEASGVEVHVATVVKISRSMFKPTAPFQLGRQLLAACRDLDRIAAGRPVALVYSNTLAVLGGAVWAWRRGLRHLWHVHEIIRQPALVRHGLPWLADRLSHKVVSNSRQTERWLLDEVPALKPRSMVIFNGLGPVSVVSESAVAAFRAQIGARPETVVVTVAGRLNHWKGQSLLIEAVALLRRENRLGDTVVAVVGDVYAGQSHMKEALLALVHDAGLEDCVQFVRFVADIYPVWSASDIAVVPSLEPEPFGMVAIEAMACGLPVLAARHGGLLDIVEDGVTGLFFEPRDARSLAEMLFRLLKDPQLRARMGVAGAQRQRAMFSLQTQIERTRAVCHELAAV